MVFTYPAARYAAGTLTPAPTIRMLDADGFAISRNWSQWAAASHSYDFAISVSNTELLRDTGQGFTEQISSITGGLYLHPSRTGTFTAMVIERTTGMVDTFDITVTAPPSSLRLTPPATPGVVGQPVADTVELVDVDGNVAATGMGANTGAASSVTVLTQPEGGTAFARPVNNWFGFNNGRTTVEVHSNVEGPVPIRVIITEIEAAAGNATPRVFTGVGTVYFGTGPAAGVGVLIFPIGGDSFVSSNQPHAAESPPFIDENGRTMIGVRDVSTALGIPIDWNQEA
jgi:hypothetical protein